MDKKLDTGKENIGLFWKEILAGWRVTNKTHQESKCGQYFHSAFEQKQ